MNIVETQKNVWKFPRNISFDIVSQYTEALENKKKDVFLIFDLRNTLNMHSSFVGFLIYTKYTVEKNGGNLTLLLSNTVEKILTILKVENYFYPHIIIVENKKTA